MLKILTLVVVALLLYPPRVWSEGSFTRGDVATITALVAGQTADAWSTRWAVTNGSGCVELNRALPSVPSAGDLARHKAIGIGATLLITGLIRLAASDHLGDHPSTPRVRRIARWAARSMEVGVGAGGAWAARGNWLRCRP